MPVRKLSEGKLRYAERMQGIKSAETLARELGVSRSWMYKVLAHCRKTGAPPPIRKMGRPRREIAADLAGEILAAYAEAPAGVVRLAKRLRLRKPNMAFWVVYYVLRAAGHVRESSARSRRRKWVRFVRLYSNAMVHVDWHIMKYEPLRGKHLVVYLDDASRCVTGYGVFGEATSANAVMVLRKSIRDFGAPGQILSDNGPQFTSTRRAASPTRSWKPTLFEQELVDCGVQHVRARPYHPQTNGKIERFFQTLEDEIGHFGGVPEFIEYYNERRLHFGLDMEGGETPLLAFRHMRADEETRRANPRWMEEDADG